MKIYCASEYSRNVTPEDIRRFKRHAVGKDCWILFAGSLYEGDWDYWKILDIDDSRIKYLDYDSNAMSGLMSKYAGNPSVSENDIISEARYQEYPLDDFLKFVEIWHPFTAMTTEELAEEINDLIRRESEES